MSYWNMVGTVQSPSVAVGRQVRFASGSAAPPAHTGPHMPICVMPRDSARQRAASHCCSPASA